MSHSPSHSTPAPIPPTPASTNSFQSLRLAEPLMRALAAEGYTVPTPIQAKAIPHVLEGRDLLGCAQTGTGKTAAFALPILHRLGGAGPATAQGGPDKHAAGRGQARRPIRVLILSPTRELASQIGESFSAYGRHSGMRHTVIYGGVNQNSQTRQLQQGVDILIATPGRLLDLMNQGYVELGRVEVFVLDEADNMLDMGFIHDIRRIVPKLPEKRQTLMFSATMPAEIRKLAEAILRDPVNVQVAALSSAADTVKQSLFYVEKGNKPNMLKHFLDNTAVTRALVFTRTKHGADKVAKHLVRSGIRAEAIHGNKSQGQRNRALASFKGSAPPVLVATDVAARGLDIDEVSHVVNYDVPNVPETYVHRIGRTGRAGASGEAVSFCDPQEREFVRDIEKLMRRSIAVRDDAPKFAPRDARDSRGDGEAAPRSHDSRQPEGRDNRHRSHPRAESPAPRHDRQPGRHPEPRGPRAQGQRPAHASPAAHGNRPAAPGHANRPGGGAGVGNGAHARSAGSSGGFAGFRGKKRPHAAGRPPGRRF